jgi:hypothetical protein
VDCASGRWRVFINNKQLLPQQLDRVQSLAYPDTKKPWLKRYLDPTTFVSRLNLNIKSLSNFSFPCVDVVVVFATFFLVGRVWVRGPG